MFISLLLLRTSLSLFFFSYQLLYLYMYLHIYNYRRKPLFTFFFYPLFFFLQLNGGVSFSFLFHTIAAVAGLCAYKAHRPQYSITIHPYALLIGFSPPLFFLLLLFSHVYAFALIINAVAHHRDATIIKVRTRLFSLTFPCTLH